MNCLHTFRKNHARYLLIMFAAITVFTVIKGYREWKQASSRPIVMIKDREYDGRVSYSADKTDRYERFHQKATHEPEQVFVKSDITSRFFLRTARSRLPQMECWQCGRKINRDKTVCPYCGGVQIHADTDRDGMPDYWELRYSFDPEDDRDAVFDTDIDRYANIEEYKGGSNPRDKKDTPLTRNIQLKVEKVYKKPVDILFSGYVEQNGRYDLVINWEGGQKTFFKQVGESIRGYRIAEFRKIVEEKRIGKELVIDKDRSFIMLQKISGEKLRLTLNTVYVEREFFARIRNHLSNDVFDVHIGSDFQLRIDGTKKTFTVTDITVDQVFYRDSRGNEDYIVWRG